MNALIQVEAGLPHQQALFVHDPSELAAQLRVEYERLEPYRALLDGAVRCCDEELRTRYGIEAKRHDILAAAEDFMLSIAGANAVDLRGSLLRPALHDHVIAKCRAAALSQRTDEVDQAGWDQAIAEALIAVEDVLVRAAILAAERLLRINAVAVSPARLLIETNPQLRELAEEDPSTPACEIERRIIARMVSTYLTARAARTH